MQRFLDSTANPVFAIPIGVIGFMQQFVNWASPYIQFIILICTLIVVGHSALKILFGKKKR